VVKKNEGLNVQLIVIDDEINRRSGFHYEKEFETYRIKKTSPYNNMMHNKFGSHLEAKVFQDSFNLLRVADSENSYSHLTIWC
jgi:hypothetical protein